MFGNHDYKQKSAWPVHSFLFFPTLHGSLLSYGSHLTTLRQAKRISPSWSFFFFLRAGIPFCIFFLSSKSLSRSIKEGNARLHNHHDQIRKVSNAKNTAYPISLGKEHALEKVSLRSFQISELENTQAGKDSSPPQEPRKIVTLKSSCNTKMHRENQFRRLSTLVSNLSQTLLNFKVLHVGDRVYAQVQTETA